MLKLIVNNSEAFCSNTLPYTGKDHLDSTEPTFTETTLFDCSQIVPNLYAFRAKDLAHELSCELELELKQTMSYPVAGREEAGISFTKVISGEFQYIDTQKLKEAVDREDYLEGMILVLFQLKILEQLLLICEDMDASHLYLSFNMNNSDHLEIYRRFLISEEEITTSCGERLEIVIPTDVETYDRLVDFMDQVDKTFQQTLWQRQTISPVIRKYLKSQALLAF